MNNNIIINFFSIIDSESFPSLAYIYILKTLKLIYQQWQIILLTFYQMPKPQ
jgi:hypothetical protein